MRRIAVQGWIATGTALPVIVFGAGVRNLLCAFQISLVASLVVDGSRSDPISFDSTNGSAVTIGAGPINVSVEGTYGLPARIC